ncbi:hypothetical protein F2Q69_00013205 [Brassica cretica]|uniref:Uncharacterized protein n=1 Tax=Brassica cretica TaxID=69181 RepID=A0A8S9R995_BRACR|nr:hypothetical protein F2Q69_00013205 [Brassica cretica]
MMNLHRQQNINGEEPPNRNSLHRDPRCHRIYDSKKRNSQNRLIERDASNKSRTKHSGVRKRGHGENSLVEEEAMWRDISEAKCRFLIGWERKTCGNTRETFLKLRLLSWCGEISSIFHHELHLSPFPP